MFIILIYRWHSGAVLSTDASQLEGSGQLGAGVCMFSCYASSYLVTLNWQSHQLPVGVDVSV